jgi:nucleoside-diphosphate-sugar epimerase
LAGEYGKNSNSYNVKSFDCTIGELFEKFAREMGVELPDRTVRYPFAYLGALFLEGIYAAGRSKSAPPLTRFKVRLIGTNRIISSDKAERELGFKPRYGIDETVKASVEWYMGKKQ